MLQIDLPEIQKRNILKDNFGLLQFFSIFGCADEWFVWIFIVLFGELQGFS